MAGTVVFTAANSSMGIPAAEHLLRTYPDYTVIFTVRNVSELDANTNRLRKVIAQFPSAKAHVLPLDLSSLSTTHSFADNIVADVKAGKYPPLAAIICNAYYWNLVGDPEPTDDGFDKTMQVSFISHAALVLKLLGAFKDDKGRVILLSSDSHWPGKNAMEAFPPSIDDLEQLVKPASGEDKRGKGYQRYANSKLAITAWMYALNRHLAKDPKLSKITAIAVNPGNMVDSRALTTNTPTSLQYAQMLVYKPLLPLLRFIMGPTLRTAAPCGIDVVELTLNPEFADERGFYTLREKDVSSPDSRDQQKQDRLWAETLRWANIGENDTALRNEFN